MDLATAPWLATLLTEVLRHDPKRIVVDLTAVTFFNARGVAVIASVRRQLPAHFELVLLRPNPLFRWLVQLAELDGPCLIEG